MAKILFLGNLGVVEIVLIALIVLLLFGGRKIPELMKGIGRGIRSFKEGARGDGEEPKQKEISPWEEKYNSEHDARLRLAAEERSAGRFVRRTRRCVPAGCTGTVWYLSVSRSTAPPTDGFRQETTCSLPAVPPPTPAIRSSTANELAAGTPHRKFRRFEKIVYLCVKHQMIR